MSACSVDMSVELTAKAPADSYGEATAVIGETADVTAENMTSKVIHIFLSQFF